MLRVTGSRTSVFRVIEFYRDVQGIVANQMI